MRGPGDREEYDADPAAIHRSRWSPLRIAGENGRVFRGWWRRAGNFMYTVVADPPPASPILLEIRDDFRR